MYTPYISPFALLINEYEYEKNDIVKEAWNMQRMTNLGLNKNNFIILNKDVIKTIENNKMDIAEPKYVDCIKYIDKIYQQNNNYTVKKYFNQKEQLLSIIKSILDRTENVESILGILYKKDNGMINLLHPLNIIEIMNNKEQTTTYTYNSNEFIVIHYPDEYRNVPDYDKEMKYYDKIIQTISIILNNLNKEAKQKQDLFVDLERQDILGDNFLSDNICVFPVDKISSVSLAPFYGWNYAVFKNNKFVGDNLITNINITGNISHNTYCTGKLPTDMDGLRGLRGNNLNSAYTKECIDINNNHYWVKANIRATKTMIEKGLENAKFREIY